MALTLVPAFPSRPLSVTGIAAAFIGCAIAVTLVEGASGKPLSAMVQGKPGHGTTLGGGAVDQHGRGRCDRPASSTTTAGTSSSPAASTARAATAPSSTPASSTSASSVPNSTTPSATPTVTAGG